MFRKKLVSILIILSLLMSFSVSSSFADVDAGNYDINEAEQHEEDCNDIPEAESNVKGIYNICDAKFYMGEKELTDTTMKVDEYFMDEFWYHDFDVYYYGEDLIEGKDYVVSREINFQKTEASVTFRGIGDFYGEKTFSFKLRIYYDVDASKETWHSAVLTWDAVKDMDGYRIETEDRCTDKVISTKDVPGGDTCSYTLDNLNPDTTYRVRIIPYTVSGEEVILHDEYEMTTWFSTEYCYEGKFYSSKKNVQKSLNSVFKKYKFHSKWKGSGQCWGYSEWVSKKICKSRKYVKINKSFTVKNVKKYVCNLPPGTHLRITNHSLVILKASKERIYWTDGNYNCGIGTNYVHYWSGTPEEFEDIYWRHAKLVGAYKPTKYR